MPGNPNLQPVKKRKKHPPDRQQPEWLFPADSENPALKPHKEPTLKEKLEKQRSIDFLTRRAVGAPSKPAPPVQLLNLIGAFLAEYGFSSTGRLFSTERQGRSKLDGWRDETGGKLEKGMPTLGKIYKEWRKEWEERRLLDMTSSDEEDDAATKREKMLIKKEKVEKQKNKAKDDMTSSSGSSSSEDGDIEMQDAPPARKTVTKALSSSRSSSSSATSSDSDADDEKEIPATKTTAPKAKHKTLKRKASPSSSSSASDSGSSSADNAPKTKKSKATKDSSSSNSDSSSSDEEVDALNPASNSAPAKAEEDSSNSSSDSNSASDSKSSTTSLAKKIALPPSSGCSSSSDSDSDSSSDNDTESKPLVSSDTSATLSDGPKKVSPGSSNTDASFSDSVTHPEPESTGTKGKLSQPPPPTTPVAKLPRKTNTPFSRVPKDIKVNERLASNAYVPYDYAQKAHEDLSVTKGKDFTKEKNKKKKGSYKGGYIDVEGKKGIKFED